MLAADSGLGKRPSTTSWGIAGSNLDAEIADRLRRNYIAPQQRLALVEHLLARGHYLSSIEDYERAEDVAARTVAAYPASPEAHLAHALALGSLHKFADEMKELDQVKKLGGPAERIDAARATVLAATGRYEEAAELTPLTDASTPVAVTSAAVLAARMQKQDEAERLFERARTKILDTSPLPFAWMDFQRATVLEAQGKESRARSYYLEAVEMVPVYTHALVHLATTDPPDVAIARLEAARKTTSNPDVLGALADAHRRAGHEADAKSVTEEARKRYDELVEKYPEAFRDHAARFYLGAGNDPAKALEFAQKNAKVLLTEEAVDLWMAAAAAVNKKEQICTSATAMSKLRWVSEPRKRLAAAALNDCPGGGVH
jgi:tetratricopeptide (TPR) repeat protein